MTSRWLPLGAHLLHGAMLCLPALSSEYVQQLRASSASSPDKSQCFSLLKPEAIDFQQTEFTAIIIHKNMSCSSYLIFTRLNHNVHDHD